MPRSFKKNSKSVFEAIIQTRLASVTVCTASDTSGLISTTACGRLAKLHRGTAGQLLTDRDYHDRDDRTAVRSTVPVTVRVDHAGMPVIIMIIFMIQVGRESRYDITVTVR